MKKLFLVAALFAATVCQAQVVLWDGEDKEVGSDGGFWNRADPTVVEEDGNKFLKFTLKANPEGWNDEHHNIALPLDGVNFKALRRLTFRMKMEASHNVLVQLEGKDGAYNAERLAWYDTANGWQVMVYEFAAGPDFDKITDDGNNVLAIWPFEKTAEGEGKTIYIDDIKVEGTMVDDKGVLAYADNSLDGDIVVTGVIGKGTYQCTWDGDWHPQAYDDYALLAAKLAPTAKTLDVRGAGRWDEDWDVIKTKCPEIKIILTDDDVTPTDGIASIENEKLNIETSVYNLAGQKVDANYKGIVIVNGKKVKR